MSIRASRFELTAHHNQLLWFCSNGQPLEMSHLAQRGPRRACALKGEALGRLKKRSFLAPVARAQRSGARIKNSSPSPEKLKPNAAALESRASNCPILSHSTPKKHWTNSRRFFRFLNHFRNLRIPNYPCDWKPGGEAFYAYVMAHWMAEHEVLAAAIFVGLSLALTAFFAVLERHYKQPLTSRRKNYFS